MNAPESSPERSLDGLDVDERRKHARVASNARVSMQLAGRELEGLAENVSVGGLLFFSDGDVEVTLVIDELGQRVERKGRLIRAQRMRGSRMGWAVEFDAT